MITNNPDNPLNRVNQGSDILYLHMQKILITMILFAASLHSQILVTAHRGSSGYAPENTFAAIKIAIDMHSDYAEIDVQETSDGEIILLHDGNLKRTTGLDKNIWKTKYDDLKKLDAGSWFGEKFKGEPIPKLLDIIDSIKGKIKLNIELKTNGNEVKLAERTVKIIKDKNFQSDCIFTSFAYSQIKRVKELDPAIKTGLIFSKVPDSLNVFAADFEVLSVHHSLVDSAFMKNARDSGKEVHVWTVNEQSEMNRLLVPGVTSIITNYPDKLKNILNQASRD